MDKMFHITPGPALTDWVTLILVVFTLWIVVAEPVIGYLTHGRFTTECRGDVSGARVSLYVRWTGMLLALGAVVVSFFAFAPGLGVGMLGLRAMRDFGKIDPVFMIILGGMGAGILVSIIASLVLKARSGNPLGFMAGGAKIADMLPRTIDEILLFVLLSVSASVVEEVVWRGLPVFLLALWFPTAGLPVVIFITAIMFGIVHTYQGLMGILASSILGAILCGLYLLTGSLLIPMLLHLVINLRSTFLLAGAPVQPENA